MDTVGSLNNRKGRPNYPTDFKERLVRQACEPGVPVSQLARQHEINVNMLFKWRRDLRAGLLTASGSRSAHLKPVMVQHSAENPDLPALPSITPSARFIEIAYADAVVRVCAGTDAALLQLVLQSLRP